MSHFYEGLFERLTHLYEGLFALSIHFYEGLSTFCVLYVKKCVIKPRQYLCLKITLQINFNKNIP